MSLTHILLIVVAMCAGAIVVLLAARSGGPRVTTIEHKTDRAEAEEEDGS